MHSCKARHPALEVEQAGDVARSDEQLTKTSDRLLSPSAFWLWCVPGCVAVGASILEGDHTVSLTAAVSCGQPPRSGSDSGAPGTRAPVDVSTVSWTVCCFPCSRLSVHSTWPLSSPSAGISTGRRSWSSLSPASFQKALGEGSSRTPEEWRSPQVSVRVLPQRRPKVAAHRGRGRRKDGLKNAVD